MRRRGSRKRFATALRCLGGSGEAVRSALAISSLNNLAEIIIIRTKLTVQRCSAELVDLRVGPALSLVVRTLKREVRAIRGCLGIYRR